MHQSIGYNKKKTIIFKSCVTQSVAQMVHSHKIQFTFFTDSSYFMQMSTHFSFTFNYVHTITTRNTFVDILLIM